MNSKTEMAKEHISRFDTVLFCLLLCLTFITPLVFSTSLLRSFEIPKVALLRSGAALLFLWWWFIHARHRLLDLLRFSSVVQAVVLVFLSAGISFFFSIEPMLSLFGVYDRQLGLITIAALTAFFIMLCERTNRQGRFVKVVRAMNLSGSLVAGYALMQYFNIDPLAWPGSFGNRPASTVGHPDYLGGLLVMTMPLCLALIYWERHAVTKGGWLVCFFLQIGALLVSQTRGAWIAAAITIPLFIALEPFLHWKDTGAFRRHAVISGVAIVAVLLAGLAVFRLHEPLQERAASITRFKEQPRLFLWRDAISVVKIAPLVGTGPETFRPAFMPYKSLELARLEHNTNYDSPHNNYLHVLATTGVLGLCAYLYLLFCCFGKGIGQITGGVDHEDSIKSLGLVAALGGYAIAMLTGVETIVTMMYLYVLAGLIAAGELKTVEGSKVEESKGVLGRYSVALVLVLASGAMVYDSARMVKADCKALAGLKASVRGNATDAHKLLSGASVLLPRESFYPLQAGVAAMTSGLHAEEDRTESLYEAIGWAERSFTHGWAPENSWNLISTAHLNLGNWKQAEHACRRGLSRDPYNVPILINLAKALALAGKRKEAREVVKKIFLIDEQAVAERELKHWMETEK